MSHSTRLVLTSLLHGVIALIIASFFLQPSYAQEDIPTEETLEATVNRIVDTISLPIEGRQQTSQTLDLSITRGSLVGKIVRVEGAMVPASYVKAYKPGDRVLVMYTKSPDGQEFFFITDFIRRKELLVLFVLFAGLVIAIGRLYGATSLIGMAASFAVIFLFILPRLIAGNNPILIALAGTMLIAPVTFYISHGLNKKTHIAIVSTIVTLLLTSVLASWVIDLLKLTGFSTEEAGFLQNQTRGILNMKGILLAGIIIAALGVLDDITIAQAGIVEQIKQANTKLPIVALFNRAMVVGRDHIASLVNTLILVYTGASLPLLLLFIDNPHPFSEVINYEFIAEEIARTLIGSIGLVLAVPISTYLASWVFSKKK